MRHSPAPSYFIRLELELDGELIEERFVEPNEVVFIGHEQRTNLLCWGRLPRKVQLFSYERGQPIVMIAPQWITQHSSPRSISPRSHPSSRAIPTPLHPGDRFTLDLDGALLHISHCVVGAHVITPNVPDFMPEAGSHTARRIALASLAVCSALWTFAAISWANVSPELRARHGSRAAIASRTTPSPSPGVAAAQPAAQPTSSPRQVGGHMPTLPMQHDSALSWQEREVHRLLQRGSEDYRACFGSEMPATRVIFDLEIKPGSSQSHIASTHVSESSQASTQILSCLTSHLNKAKLPHYQDAFAVQFHVIFDPND